MKNIVLCDDHPLIRSGLRDLLNDQPGWKVVAEAASGNEVLALVHEYTPEILFTDLSMPGLPVPDIIRQIRRSKSPVKIIVFTMHSDSQYVRDAMSAGADAFITKDAPSDEIPKAINAVMSGQKYFSTLLSSTYTGSIRPGKPEKSATLAITPREKQVLSLAAEGYSSAEIATKLKISPRTAETHRANLMRKLNLHSQTDLVHFAFRNALIPVPKPV